MAHPAATWATQKPEEKQQSWAAALPSAHRSEAGGVCAHPPSKPRKPRNHTGRGRGKGQDFDHGGVDVLGVRPWTGLFREMCAPSPQPPTARLLASAKAPKTTTES
eukprot:11641577-Alexandrium_andersonii.AAC.1